MLFSRFTNAYFPLCSFSVSLLLFVLYFFKKNNVNEETKIYSRLVIFGLLESFIYLLLTITGDLFYTVNNAFIFVFVNRIMSVIYILWMSYFFLYTLLICDKVSEKVKDIFRKFVLIFNVLFGTASVISPISLTLNTENLTSNVFGLGINILYFICFIYYFLVLVFLIGNYHGSKNKKKMIPLICLEVLFTFSFIIRAKDPYFNITSNVFSFVLLIMYHTIENPDLRLINELELAKNDAERANNAKTEFLSSMSHEIRTPLNAIVGFSNSIMEDDSLEEAQNEAKDIIMASNNLLEIVNGILDISKIEAGKMEIVEVEYHPMEVYNNIVKLVLPRLEEKPIELKTHFASDIPYTLFGDMGKNKEIITNILTNACKYTEKGIIDFSVSVINDKDKCSLVISIEDTGRGIKADKIDKLFSKFDRLDEDKNTTLEGTGLGLAITKSLVEMMGGKIVVQSKYGSGSKFTVYLTQKIVKMNPDKIEEKEEIKEEKIDYSKYKLLVVDDNNLNIKVAGRLLRGYNITPDSCMSGDECISKLKDNKYDLILMDDMMPGKSGVETFKELKKDDKFNTPVVILTANAISGMKEKYLEDGLDDYLAKPIDKLELERVLKKFLK